MKLLKSIHQFFTHKYDIRDSIPPGLYTTDEQIKLLVDKHGNSLQGLYILERAFLRAHGTPNGKLYIKPGKATLKFRPHRLRKTKDMLAAGKTYPVTKFTAGRNR